MSQLTRAVVATRSRVPVIASGGMGRVEHLRRGGAGGHADAVAMADVLHYKRLVAAATSGHGARRGRHRGEGAMSQRVLVVDYGIGNLLSVCRAFEACGASVELDR